MCWMRTRRNTTRLKINVRFPRLKSFFCLSSLLFAPRLLALSRLLDLSTTQAFVNVSTTLNSIGLVNNASLGNVSSACSQLQCLVFSPGTRGSLLSLQAKRPCGACPAEAHSEGAGCRGSSRCRPVSARGWPGVEWRAAQIFFRQGLPLHSFRLRRAL